MRHCLPRENSTMNNIALDATLRAAAQRTLGAENNPLAIFEEDIRHKVRRHYAPLSIVLVIDNSYSIHADQMIERTKGIALSLLKYALTNGERIALVTFQKVAPRATIALPMTRSASLARKCLERIPLANRTPLASALRLTGNILRQETLKRENTIPLAIIITDGLPTVALLPGGNPLTDLIKEARTLQRRKITTVVADSSNQSAQLGGCGQEIAHAAGGKWLSLQELISESHK